MLDRSEVGKRGYLDRDFRLVHLKDSLAQKIDYHYHEFDKLVIFLGGKVTYVVEGVTYFLKPWDIVLIQHNLIHRPIIHAEEPYERAVLWLGRDWIAQRSRSRRAAGRLSGQEPGAGVPPSADWGGGASWLRTVHPAVRGGSAVRGVRRPPYGGYPVPAAFDSGEPGLPPGQHCPE